MLNNKGLNIGDGMNFVTCEQTFTDTKTWLILQQLKLWWGVCWIERWTSNCWFRMPDLLCLMLSKSMSEKKRWIQMPSYLRRRSASVNKHFIRFMASDVTSVSLGNFRHFCQHKKHSVCFSNTQAQGGPITRQFEFKFINLMSQKIHIDVAKDITLFSVRYEYTPNVSVTSSIQVCF